MNKQFIKGSNNNQILGDNNTLENNYYISLMNELSVVDMENTEEILNKLLKIEDEMTKKATNYDFAKFFIYFTAAFLVIFMLIFLERNKMGYFFLLVAVTFLLGLINRVIYQKAIIPKRIIEASRALSVEVLKIDLLRKSASKDYQNNQNQNIS